MKQTLHQRLENEIKLIKSMLKNLEKEIPNCIENNMLMSASVKKIKLETLQMLVNRLEQLLTR